MSDVDGGSWCRWLRAEIIWFKEFHIHASHNIYKFAIQLLIYLSKDVGLFSHGHLPHEKNGRAKITMTNSLMFFENFGRYQNPLGHSSHDFSSPFLDHTMRSLRQLFDRKVIRETAMRILTADDVLKNLRELAIAIRARPFFSWAKRPWGFWPLPSIKYLGTNSVCISRCATLCVYVIVQVNIWYM